MQPQVNPSPETAWPNCAILGQFSTVPLNVACRNKRSQTGKDVDVSWTKAASFPKVDIELNWGPILFFVVRDSNDERVTLSDVCLGELAKVKPRAHRRKIL